MGLSERLKTTVPTVLHDIRSITVEMDKKTKSCQQRKRASKKETNGKFRTENCNKGNLKIRWSGLVEEWRGQRKHEQDKLRIV